MKTKITVTALVLAFAIAATLGAANPFASAKAVLLPVEGDPIPGVDVSIEQSPSGKVIARTQTDPKGTAVFTGIAPGKYVMRTVLPSGKSSNNYNSSKCNCVLLAGATIDSGSLDFSNGKPGMAKVTVRGWDPQRIEMSAKVGPERKSTPKPSN